MIYIFGDSWGFSYKTMSDAELKINNFQNRRQMEYFFGRSMAAILEELFNTEVTNCCERGMNNFQTIEKMKLMSGIFNPGDQVFVLQSTPLRGAVISSTYAMGNSVPAKKYVLKLQTPMDIIEIIDNFLLKDFYKELSDIQKNYNIRIIVHGGCCKLIIPLAKSYGLVCTEKSSTEWIVPGYKDTYFYDEQQVADSIDEFLHIKNYKKDTALELKILDEIELAEDTRQNHKMFFSKMHTTEKGTRKVCDMLFNYIDIKHYLVESKKKRTLDFARY